jgi:hypothetical protein
MEEKRPKSRAKRKLNEAKGRKKVKQKRNDSKITGELQTIAFLFS